MPLGSREEAAWGRAGTGEGREGSQTAFLADQDHPKLHPRCLGQDVKTSKAFRSQAGSSNERRGLLCMGAGAKAHLKGTALMGAPASCCHVGNVSPFWLELRVFKWIRDFIYVFTYLAPPTACGSSQVRDWIWATAVTYASVVAMPDPQPTALGRGLNPWLSSDLSWCRDNTRLLLHCIIGGIQGFFFFFF